jgi:hypothetical protein
MTISDFEIILTIFFFFFFFFCGWPSGEITPGITKETKEYIKNVFHIEPSTAAYDRKLDITVVGNYSKVPLSVTEWKEQKTYERHLLLQQTKNVRVNKCHLSHILKRELKDSEKEKVLSLE